MFEVTIKATTARELAEAVDALAIAFNLAPTATVEATAITATVEPAPDLTVAAKPKAAPAKPKATPAKEEPAKEPVKAKLLDFNTEVAPVVVKIVESHGKPLVSSVLEKFGVARASEVAPELWPELLDALNEAVA